MGIMATAGLVRPTSYQALNPADDMYYTDGYTGSFLTYGGRSLSGIGISEDTAMQSSAVWSCVRLISESLATVPLVLYRRLPGDRRVRATDHYLYDVLHDRPNSYQDAFEFREMMTAHCLLTGNAYARLVSGRRGFSDQLLPLHPNRMQITAANGTVVYRYREPDGASSSYTDDEIFHLRGLSNGSGLYSIGGYNAGGRLGMAPIQYARESIGLALATEQHGARLFSQGVNPSGVLTHPGTLSKDAKKRLKDDFVDKHVGLQNAHKPMLLEEGLKWERVGLSNLDAQFLECVAPGTLITMADGSRRAAELLQPGDRVLSWNSGPTAGRVAKIGIQESKPLVKIVTARGRSLTASSDHPYLARYRLRTAGGRADKTPDLWIPAAELRTGMYVRVGIGNDWQGEALDPQTAWLLGAMVGDGYMRAQGFSFTKRDPGVIAAVRAAVEELGGGLGKIPSSQCGWRLKTNGAGCKGSPLRWLFADAGLIGKHSDTKRVPEMVMRGGPSAWAGFMAGYLDTDGSVRDPNGKQKPAAYWSSINRDLLEDCQHLLAMLGIQSAIYPMGRGGHKMILGIACEAQPLWGLYVMGASELAALAACLDLKHDRKRSRLAVFGAMGASRYRPENFQYDRITDVLPLQPGPTIGIEIESTHTHITNGLVTHNSRQFQVADIARFFRVPLHMIQETTGSTSWGSGLEQLSLAFVIYTLLPWARRWEQAVSRDLISQPKQFYCEYLFDSLLRADIKTRYDAYATARNWGWLSTNDIRRMENMEPVEGGDRYLQPLNMQDAGSAMPVPLIPPPEGPRPNEPNGSARPQTHYYLLLHEAASRIVRKETKRVADLAKHHASDTAGWLAAVGEFWTEHAGYVHETIGIERDRAAQYCGEQLVDLRDSGAAALENGERRRVAKLVALALEENDA